MKRIYWVGFIAVFCIVVAYLNLFHLWDYRPQSAHQWRQCDGLSIFLNYFYNLNPFQPSIMNQMKGNGQTVSEFPIFYYIGALVCKFIGYKEGILRLIHFIILSVGLGYYFYWLLEGTRCFSYSILSTILLFTSPILVYYSFNFLPDSAALGACLGSIALIEASNHKQQPYSKMLLFFMTMTVLLKPPLLLYPLSLILLQIFENKSLPKRALSLLLIPTGIGIAWVLLSYIYKTSHQNSYFLSQLMPIWKIDKETITDIASRIANEWLWMYFSKPVWLLFLAFFVVTLVWRFSHNQASHIVRIILFCSIAICIFSMWYYQFNDHDYYFLMLMPFFAILLAQSYHVLDSLKLSKAGIVLLFMIVCGQTQDAKTFLWDRHQPENPFQKDALPFYQLSREVIKERLGELKIPEDATILVLGDGATNTSLYFLERKGWTNYNLKEEKITPDDALLFYQKRGAEYFFISEKSGVNKIPEIFSFIGRFESFIVYKYTGFH